MKVTDIIFSLICGRIIGLLLDDFLKEWGIHAGIYQMLAIWIALPFICLLCLWIASVIGRRFLFVFQATKHVLVGAFAMVLDVKLFEALAWAFTLVILLSPIIHKALSFLGSTLVKYFGNKYWAFSKHEKENLRQEISQFFAVTLIGLVIDLAVFYYFTQMISPQFGFSPVIWLKLSIILAAFAAAVWNFVGYKFLVFKK